MICAYILRKLPLYVSDDLTPRITGRLIKHLEHCKACRLELNMLQAFQSHLGQWVTPLPSKTLDGFTDEVMQHIARPTAIEFLYWRL